MTLHVLSSKKSNREKGYWEVVVFNDETFEVARIGTDEISVFSRRVDRKKIWRTQDD